MKTLYIAWKDQTRQRWLTVGRLCFNGKKYIFCYTKGAKKSESFIPFGGLRNLNTPYISSRLLPLFENRILNSKRPEFKTLIQWLDLDQSTYDPLDILALTEGKRGTDSLELFPYPKIDKDNNLVINFFSHGLSHINNWAAGNLDILKSGLPLYPLSDHQNEKDADAVLLRSPDPITFVGYCPRYLAKDIKFLLNNSEDNIRISVKKFNKDAPLTYQLLCTLEAKCPSDFMPFQHEDFQPIPADTNDLCNEEECMAVCK